MWPVFAEIIAAATGCEYSTRSQLHSVPLRRARNQRYCECLPWRMRGRCVAEAFIDRAGSPWDESNMRDHQDLLDQARTHLGDEQLERAYARGKALSLEKALDLALGKTGSA
jgi:hypothetical protein